MKEELIKLGFTNNEATIYLALLDLGLTTAGNIVNRTKLHRTIVYFNLEKLKEKGLVTNIIIKKTMHFEVTESTELKEFILKQKQEIEKKENIVNKILPEIKKRRTLLKQESKAVIYNGISGIKTAMDAITKSGKNIFLFSAGGGLDRTVGKHFRLQWHKKVDLNNLSCKIIFGTEIKGHLKKSDFPNSVKIRYLPKPQNTQSTIVFYGDVLLNFVWGENPFVVYIQNQDIVNSYKYYFDYLWKISKP